MNSGQTRRDLTVAIVMTREEVRELAGRTVLYGGPGREPEEVVITRVSLVLVEVSWPGLRRYKSVWPRGTDAASRGRGPG
jgi:hypothetical protein